MTTAMMEQLSSPRILAGTKGDIWVQVALDGDSNTDSTGTPTVTVTDEAGTVVVASTAATVTAGTGRLSLTLTAAQTASVNRLTATWAGVILGGATAITLTSYHEVVGDHLFTLSQARNWDNAALADEAKYPNGAIAEARDRIADTFADILGFDVGLRAHFDYLDSHDSYCLSLGRARVGTIRTIATRASGTQTWTAFTAAELADLIASPYGRVERVSLGSWPLDNRCVRVLYEAGQQPIAYELRVAALKVLRQQLIKSDIPGRYISVTNQDGNAVLASPGMRGSYVGLPEVDEVLNRLADKAMKMGFA